MLLSNSLTKLSNEDSAKLPALRAPIPYVPRMILCPGWSSAPRAPCFKCSCASCTSCFMCSRASCSTCSPSHHALVPYVPYVPRVPHTSFSTCSCVSFVLYSYVASCLALYEPFLTYTIVSYLAYSMCQYHFFLLLSV